LTDTTHSVEFNFDHQQSRKSENRKSYQNSYSQNNQKSINLKSTPLLLFFVVAIRRRGKINIQCIFKFLHIIACSNFSFIMTSKPTTASSSSLDGANSNGENSSGKRKPDSGNNRKIFYTTCREGMAEEYMQRHNEIPPEVCAGLRTAGVASLSIHRLPGTNILVLTIDKAGSNLDLERATGPGSAYRKNPICNKWEVDMETQYHNGWLELEEIHSSNVEWNRSLGLIS
jgi:L-rhamnose mutarotase